MKTQTLCFFIFCFISLSTWATGSPPVSFQAPEALVHKFENVWQPFVREVLLPTLGQRAIWTYPAQITENRWEWVISGRTLAIAFLLDQDIKPHIAGNTLYWPLSEPWASMAGWLRRLFLGTPLHPYDASPDTREERKQLGEPSLIFKPAQAQAVARIHDFFEHKTHQKLLIVAPPNTGKSIILQQAIEQGLAHGFKRILVLADREKLVSQLYHNVSAETPNLKAGFKTGKGQSGDQEEIDVWFTTRHSWLLDNLAWEPDLIIYDEAHHIVAPTMKEYLESVGNGVHILLVSGQNFSMKNFS